MATQYSNKPIVTNGLVYALDFGNQKSYVSGSSSARSLVFNPTPATFQTVPAGDYQGLAAAYSVRKVVSSYTGSAMMVQSASVSQSIGFDVNGNLNTASIAAFAGSGDAFVKIWYDQSGNGRDATQTTLANQPKIYSGSQGSVVLENGRPALEFDGSNDGFSVSIPSPSTLGGGSEYSVVSRTSSSNPIATFTDGGFNNMYSLWIWPGTGFLSRFGTSFQNFGNLSTINQMLISINRKASTTEMYNNNTLLGDLSNITLSSQTITQFGNGPQATNGKIQESLLFGNNQSTNRTSIENNINAYYSIYSPLPGSPIPGLTSGLANFESPDALLTNQTFTGFSYDRGNSTIMYVGETKGTSSLFTQDTNLSVITTTSSVGFGSTSNNLGRTYLVSGLKHVTLRFSSGSVDCFVNGIPVPANSVFPTGSSVAGGKFAIPVYTGSLGLFQVYNRPLTGDEIWNNYQLTAPRYGLGAVQNKPYTLDDNAYLFLSQSGITDPIITGSINTFVLGLKSASLWDKMIAIYPFVGTGSVGVNLTGSHRWNLKEPSLVTYPLTFTGSWNGSVSGSTPSGSNTNITAGGTTPSIYYPNYSTSSAHISILSYDTPTSSSFLAGTGIDTETAVSTLAGDYGTPAAAYSVRKVRTAYSGALMDVRRSIDNVTSSIGYVSNGDLDTGSLSTFVNAVGEFSPGNYSGLAAAYSLRKVSASYSGNAIDVRRDSDNTTGSIGFDASGNLDTGSLLNFVYTGSTTLPGTYSGLFAAYSLRRVVPTYTGSAIMVRSGSVSQSIGFDSFGNLNTASIASFAGSGDAFVSIWYDQSGNNNHASQSTAANQPKIYSGSLGSVITSSGRPALVFDGINDGLVMTNLHNQSYLDQYFVTNTTDTQYLNPNGDTSTRYGYVGQSGSNSTNLYANYGTPSIYANGTLFTGSTRDDVYNFLTGSKVVVHQSASTTGWPQYSFGNYTDWDYSGYLQELVVYTSSQASKRTFIENNINTYYNVYARPSGYVTQWYDQSGNNRHATQSVSTQQPLIVSSGSLITLKGKPSIYFDSVDDAMLTPTLLNRPYAVILVAQQEVGSYIQRIINSPTRNSLIAITRVQETVAAAGDISSVPIGLVNTPYVVSLVNDTTSSQVYSNTVNKTTTFNNNDFGLMNFGASGVYNEPAQAFVSEVIAYTGSIQISSSRTFIENNINNYYSIYTSSNAGYVARWYDQSGNNRHATQTATGSQPAIIISGSLLSLNSRPRLNFSASVLNFTPYSSTTINTFGVIKPITISTGYTGYYQNVGAANGFKIVSRTISYFRSQFIPYAGSSEQMTNSRVDPSSRGSVQYLETWIYNNSPAELFQNSTDIVEQTDVASGWLQGTAGIGAMAYPSGAPSGEFDIQEIVTYTSNISNTRQSVEYGINNYYNIYPQTSSFTTSSFTIKATPTGITGAINNQPLNGISSTGPVGFITVSRTGSNALTIARNGVTSSFTVPASGALSTGIYLGASNYNGITVGSSPLGISFASVGVGLTGTDITNLTNLVNSYKIKLKSTDNIVTDGLTLYLDAGNTLSYPGTGTTWSDLSIYQNNGILTNGPTFSSANSGSIVFDGVDDYIETNTIIPTGNNSYTMGVWAKSTSSGIQNRVMGNASTTTGQTGTDIIWGYPSSNVIYCIRRNGSNDGNRDTQSSVISNLTTSWHYITATYNHTGGGTVLYVDGIQVGTNTTLGFTSSLPFRIGRDGDGTDRFNGNIANVQLYNRALTATEVLQNFNALRGRFGV